MPGAVKTQAEEASLQKMGKSLCMNEAHVDEERKEDK